MASAEIVALRAAFAQVNAQQAGKVVSVQERRAAIEAATRGKALPAGCRFEESVWGGIACEDITPARARPSRTIFYLHGGAFQTCSPRTHRAPVALLADIAAARAVVVDYRLGPEHPYPAAAEDAVAAYLALIETRKPSSIVVVGDSAGGGLALMLALRLKARGAPQPAGYCLLSPWADFTQSARTYQTRAEADLLVSKERLDAVAAGYLAGHDPRDPLASPVFGDFAGLAPMLVHVGADEVLLGDAIAITEAAGAANVAVRLEVWPDMPHVWHNLFDRLEEGRRAMAVVGQWIAERLAEAE